MIDTLRLLYSKDGCDEAALMKELTALSSMDEQNRCTSKELSSSDNFWTSDRQHFFPILSKCGRTLMIIVPHECQCERIFSYQKLAHTAIRSRMSAAHVQAECVVRANTDLEKWLSADVDADNPDETDNHMEVDEQTLNENAAVRDEKRFERWDHHASMEHRDGMPWSTETVGHCH